MDIITVYKMIKEKITHYDLLFLDAQKVKVYLRRLLHDDLQVISSLMDQFHVVQWASDDCVVIEISEA